MSVTKQSQAHITSELMVYLIDDDETVREALCYLIESVGLKVRPYGRIIDFLDEYRSVGIKCLVLDVRLPGMSGMEFLEHIQHSEIDLPVIVLTGHGTVSMASRALRMGVVDFIQKPHDDQLLLDRIHEALERSRMDCERREHSDRFFALTPREQEVVSLIAQGRHNKEIAHALGISCRTVEAHRMDAMRRLDVRSTAALIALAFSVNAAQKNH